MIEEPPATRRPPSAARALALLVALVSISLAGCKSPDEHRREADEQVYELVLERRAKLSLGEGEFTIEPDPESLRQRVLRGEVATLDPLSIVECLEIGAENSREYQSRKERLYLVALDLTLERWRFQIQKNGDLAAVLDHSEDGSETAVIDGVFSFTRLLGSGALIVGDIGLNLMRTLTSSDAFSPVSDIGLGVTQPLLRGFGRRIVMEPLTQAERDLVYEVRAFERFRRTFAIDVADRYYRLLQLEDAVENQARNYENLVRLTARNEELARAGRLSDIEFGQARQNELRSRVSLLETHERLGQQRDAFKLFLGLPIDFELPLDPGALAALAEEELSQFGFDADTAVRFALANRLDHLTALDEVDDAGRRIEVAADQLRAELNLAGDIRVTSEGGRPIQYNFDDPSWALGFNLDLPLDRLPERNDYRAALLTFQAAQRGAEQSQDVIDAQLRDELREAETRREGYEIQLAAVDLAEKRIESTRLKLEAGRADTRDLLEAEESLLEAQNGATEALIDYTLARLALFRDMELLRVDENGLAIEETLLESAAADEGTEARP